MTKLFTSLNVSDMLDKRMFNNTNIKNIVINCKDGLEICLNDFNITNDIDELYCDNIIDNFDTGVLNDGHLQNIFKKCDKQILKDELYNRSDEFISYDNRVNIIEDCLNNINERLGNI